MQEKAMSINFEVRLTMEALLAYIHTFSSTMVSAGQSKQYSCNNNSRPSG